ncbi:MAG: PhzF family phenazine biosynthesis protein [Anaerolineaceae bacterium]|nr:PhzF family phenazine biosynthesis protein [Anaerolineaceae bacterium]
MRRYAYKKIDAFTSGASLGNPAACIFLNERQVLTDEEMLLIAQQHKGFVSEMVYCKQTPGKIHLTYYSSECEVDFCGHGTIACMYSLIKQSAALMAQPEIEIVTRRKGVLTVTNRIGKEDAVYISAPQAQHLGTSLTRAEIADQLGLAAAKISTDLPLDCINAGLATLIVPIEALEDEISVYPDQEAVKGFCEQHDIDIVLIFCMQVQDKTHFAHTRVFAARFGYLEDPATGSGNSAFGNYLLKNKLWNGKQISVEQGSEDMVFNTVRLAAENGKVLFGGSATERIIGEYLL